VAKPNYTCVETVERSSRQRARRNFRLVDTLRADWPTGRRLSPAREIARIKD
jgi:hypothetical protein